MLLSVSSPPTPAPETGWPNRHLEVEGSRGLEEVEDGGGGGGGGIDGGGGWWEEEDCIDIQWCDQWI